MRTLFFSLVVAQTIAACTARESPEGAGGSSGTGASVGGGGSDGGEAWAAVSARVEAAASENGVADLGLYVFDETDQRVYALELGAFRSSTNIAVASASKLVSGMVLFDVIRRGALTLDSTPGQVLGWIGPTADLTLKHLLSFTSGLDPEPPCTHSLLTTLEACVDNIGTTAAIAAPGARFDYGPSHLHVAARMAEVATGKSWDALFDEVFRAPLQLASDARYYTLPKQSSGEDNPLVAGGLRVSTDEYAKLLSVAYHRGNGTVGTPELFDLQSIEPYPNCEIGNSPVQALGYSYRYGLTAWLECDTPAEGCAVFSSPGAYGFTPWIDREHRYYAMLAMEITSTGAVVAFAVELAQSVQPLIVEALQQQ